MKNASGYTHWVVVILIAIMAVGLVGTAWYYEENKEEVTTPTITATTNTNNENVNISNGEKNFSSRTLGIEFQYPKEWPLIEKLDNDDNYVKIIDLSHIDNYLPEYANLPPDQQLQHIGCEYNYYIECEERVSNYGVNYMWRVEDTPGGLEYRAYVATGKKILSIDFQDKNNYEKREAEYQKLLSSLKIFTDISEWETYTNDTYGYTFQYPLDWEVIETTSVVTNLKPQENHYLFEGGVAYPVTIAGDKSETATEYLAKIDDDKKTTVTINNLTANKVEGYFNSTYYVFSNQNDNGYITIGNNAREIYSGGNITEAEFNELENTFEQILSTITIGVVNTSKWETYINEEYEYLVKYPEDGSYAEKDSGNENKNDLGYIVDFVINDIGIRITASENTTNIQSLEELLKSNLALSISEGEKYEDKNINGNRAFKFFGYITEDDDKTKIGANTILLTDDYYYQIKTGTQFSPVFTSERKMVYETFINTFQYLDETDNSKIYSDEELGYSFTIPDGWYLHGNGKIWLPREDMPDIGNAMEGAAFGPQFNISKSAFNKHYLDISTKDEFIERVSNGTISTEWVKRNGLDMYRVIKYVMGEVETYYYFQNDNVFTISHWPFEVEGNYTNDFESVVNSFTLLN